MDLNSAHRILISAENNAYMAWQCQLLHYSSVSRLGKVPLIVVHGSTDAPLSPGFLEIINAGGLVRRAPSYRTDAHGKEYPPRNTPGTLLHAAQMNYFGDRYFVLCDPDMLFVKNTDFGKGLSGDQYPRLLDFAHREVRGAAHRFGVALDAFDNPNFQCGVPHVIPIEDAERLAREWLAAIDSFKSTIWERSMHSFGFAVTKLGIDLKFTKLTFYNERSHDQLPRDAAMIHYCVGDRAWSKRRFWADADVARVWQARALSQDGTVLSEILSQIRAAKDFYSSSNIW